MRPTEIRDKATRIARRLPPCAFLLPLLLALAAPAGAQIAAHFKGAITSVGRPAAGYVGAAADSASNLYFTQSVWNASSGAWQHQILHVTPADPQCAFGGCDTLSTQAWPVPSGFDPNQLATDAQGNLYIAGGTAVLELPVAALAGTPPGSCASAACVALGGAGLVNATGVAVDASGNVYIADQGAGTIRLVPPTDPTCTQSLCATVASGLGQVYSLAVDAAGNVYSAPGPSGGTPYKFTLQSGGGYTAAALAAALGPSDQSSGVAVDNAGDVYLADNSALPATIYKATPTGGAYSLTTLLAPGADACIVHAAQLALTINGNLVITDTPASGACPARELQSAGVNFGPVATGSTGPTVSLAFVFDPPTDHKQIGPAQVFSQGNAGGPFEIANTGTCSTSAFYSAAGDNTCTVDVRFSPTQTGAASGEVELVDGAGNPIATVSLGGIGTGPQAAFTPGTTTTFVSGSVYGLYRWPYGLATDSLNNVFVTDQTADAVFEFNSGGLPLQELTSENGLWNASGAAVDFAGNLYVADTNDGWIQKASRSFSTAPFGPLQRFADSPFLVALATDSEGSIYVVNGSSKFQKFYAGNPSCLGQGGGCPYFTNPLAGVNASESHITGIAIDGFDTIFIADDGLEQVVDVKRPAVIADHDHNGIGAGQGSPSFRIAVDSIGNLFISDAANDRILEVPRGYDGSYDYKRQITLLDASSGLYLGFGGDIAVDGNRNVYVTDVAGGGAGFRRVLKLNQAAAPNLDFVSLGPGAGVSRAFTITNSGNAPLSFPAPPAGFNPAISGPFTLDPSSTCPIVAAGASDGTLAAGATCSLVVNFNPATGANANGSLVITDNDLNVVTTQTSNLTGSVASNITLSPDSLDDGTVGAAYNVPLQAGGGTAPYTYAVTGGALPPGLTLSPAGVLSGVPTAADGYDFTVTATDAQTLIGSAEYYLSIAPASPVITWTAPAPITQGTPLSSAQLNAGASVPGSFVYSPPAGTMLEAGTQQLSVTFTPYDSEDYATVTAGVTLTVNPPSPPVVRLGVTLAAPIATDGHGNYVATLLISNHGNAAAAAVRLSSAALIVNQDGLKTTASLTSMPLALGTIAANGSATATVTFPAAAGGAGPAALRAGVAYTGGSASTTLHVTLNPEL